MSSQLKRLIAGVVIAIIAGATGYFSHSPAGAVGAGLSQTVSTPAPGTIRVLYSLDKKNNDQEIIALIDAAKSHIYFAMYEFTLQDIANALVAAKKRGVAVEGLVDSGESSNSYDAPVINKLKTAGIPIATEHHAGGAGIMHIKAIVTDQAYALGSYNWTNSATTLNDELLEIGTDEMLRATYETILKRLIVGYGSTQATAPAVSGKTYDYLEAKNHVGEQASVKGVLVDSYTSASGTVFLDFCKAYKTCPFSGVIFADDAKKFGDLSRYTGKAVTLTGTISSYQGKAEIVLSDPAQLHAP